MAKFKGENSKVTAAKDKKAAAKADKDGKEQAVKESKEAEEWSKGAKKPGKAEAAEAKKAALAAKKAELDALKREEEKELAKIKPKKPIKSGSDTKAAKKESKIDSFIGSLSSSKGSMELSASNIDDALDLLSIVDDSESAVSLKAGGIDQHPERRAKAAYNAFEARRLPELKIEHKGLRLTQMKQVLWKEWQKSPENPFNQAHLTYNASKGDKKTLIEESKNDIESRLKA